MNAGPKKVLARADPPHGVMETAAQLVDVPGGAVRQSRIILIPYVFGRVEFGSVSREPLDMDAGMAFQVIPDLSAPVDGSPVPQKDDGALEVFEQVFKESNDIEPREVVRSEVDIEAHALPLGRDCEGVDGRNAVMFVDVAEERRLPTERPGPLDVRDEQEPTFVEEDEVGSQHLGFFLSEAISGASSGQSLPRCAAKPVARASDSLNPGWSRVSTHGIDDTSRRNADGLFGRCVAGSTDRWSSQRARGLRPASRGVFLVGPGKVWEAVPKRLGASNRTLLFSGRPATSGTRSSPKRLKRSPRQKVSCQFLAAGWRADAASIAPGRCLGVS